MLREEVRGFASSGGDLGLADSSCLSVASSLDSAASEAGLVFAAGLAAAFSSVGSSFSGGGVGVTVIARVNHSNSLSPESVTLEKPILSLSRLRNADTSFSPASVTCVPPILYRFTFTTGRSFRFSSRLKHEHS